MILANVAAPLDESQPWVLASGVYRLDYTKRLRVRGAFAILSRHALRLAMRLPLLPGPKAEIGARRHIPGSATARKMRTRVFPRNAIISINRNF